MRGGLDVDREVRVEVVNGCAVDPDYADQLETAVNYFVEISARLGSPATSEDIEAFKGRLVASSPRTAFELRIKRGELPSYEPVFDHGWRSVKAKGSGLSCRRVCPNEHSDSIKMGRGRR